MTESVTETRKISYWENIKNSFSGIIVGVILFIASFVVLWSNEGNNVVQLDKANYMHKTAIEITADNIDRSNDNKLVQVSGTATTDSVISDKIISVPNTFVLARKVEMYQWEEDVNTETKDKLGGSTTETKTYTYKKVWSEHSIDSQDFKKSGYDNPAFPIKSQKYYASSGKLGEFKLTNKQTHSMNDYSAYDQLPQKPEYKIFNNMYYKGYDPENPRIGDIRISYEIVPSGVDISIIGQQKSNNTLTSMPFKESSVYVQQSGLKTTVEMLNTFKHSNKIFTNIIRVAGWLLMYMGLNMLINPLVVVFKVVPFVEKIVGTFSSGIVFLISLALSLLTIAIAWFAYRPFLSIGLLLIISGICFLLKNKFISAKSKE